MFRFRNLYKTCRVFRTAFQILLIGSFFLAAHPQPSGPAGDDAAVNDSSLASLKHPVDAFSTSSNRGEHDGQRREAFLSTAVLHRFRFERVPLLTANQPHALRQPSVLS
jgi:hypothetical protein